jgi:hypothetical protein
MFSTVSSETFVYFVLHICIFQSKMYQKNPTIYWFKSEWGFNPNPEAFETVLTKTKGNLYNLWPMFPYRSSRTRDY